MIYLKAFLISCILLMPWQSFAASCTACAPNAIDKNTVFIDFTQTEVPPSFATVITPASAADNQVSFLSVKGEYLEYIQQAANSDIVFSRDSTGVSWNGATVKGGWVIPNDNTDNEGIEISRGLTAGISKGIYTVGTDTAEIELTFAIPDVSDYDVAIVGFRKVAAYCANVIIPTTGATGPDCYTDLAAFNINAGGVYTDTVLNGGGGAGLSAVDSTINWLDTEVHSLKVKVSAAGLVTWFVDGTVLTATQEGANTAFTFDDTDTIMPAIIFTKGSNAADTPPIFLQMYLGPAR